MTDTEMLEAQYILSTQEGLFVESASAATVAYLLKKAKSGKLKNETVVCVLSGDGLKDPSVVIKAAIQPPTIYPKVDEFMKLFDSKFFDNKTMVFFEKDQVIFTSMPTTTKIKSELGRLFGPHYDDRFVLKVERILSSFIQKGKAIKISDFQDIVQDARETLNGNKPMDFHVKDFKVCTAMNQISDAEVTVMISDTEYRAEHSGVGPVDAVIQALCKACPNEISFKLTDYQVKMRSQGVNAAVYVELKLLKDGFASEGHAASPDIIQASVEAFQDAYNACV